MTGIVHHSAPVLLIGGGSVGAEQLALARALCSVAVAADSGADAALAHGIRPDAVIGDLDSLSPETRAALPATSVHRIPEQDSTDFDKCLRNIDAPLVIGVGFGGARVDHELAAFNSLVRRPERRCLLLGDRTLTFLAPPALLLPLSHGTPVSLFPLGAVEAVSDGLLWPIGGLNFTPDGQIGTSNMAIGEVSMNVTAPKMLVILPAHCLEIAVRALLDTPQTWLG